MARRAARIRDREESATRTSERSIPGSCGRMRCNASPIEARYNTLLRSVLGVTPPPRAATRRKGRVRENNPLQSDYAHPEVLNVRARRRPSPVPRLFLADKVRVLLQALYVGGDEPGAVRQVFERHDLIRRVHVAVGYRDEPRGYSLPLELYGVRVRAGGARVGR